MTMRRLLALGLVLSGLSLIPWVRADGTAEPACCETITAADLEDCQGGTHDEALTRYRSNQTRHWRSMVVGGK